VNGFRFDTRLGTFHFGSSLMVALVKGPLFYFLQMFSNLCVQIYSFGLSLMVRFSTFIPNLVHSTTHSLRVTVTLQVTEYEDPLTDL